MKRRIMSMLLVCCLLMSLLVIPASAVEDASPISSANYGGHTYALYDLGMNWQEARNYCESIGGHLATITSAEEQLYINSLIDGAAKRSYWIGLSDEAESWNWTWVTGEAYSYSNWARNEPNHGYGGAEHYVAIVSYNTRYDYEIFQGEWNDHALNRDLESFGFICEWDDTKTDNTLFQSQDKVYVETLPYRNWDRYTGNEGDSFISKLGTRNSSTDINGTTYTYGLEAWVARWNYTNEISWVWKEWDIGQKYSALSGVISISKDCYNRSSFNTVIQFVGDGKTLYETTLTPSASYPITLNIDVSGVKILRISLKDSLSSRGGTSFLLGDLTLHKVVETADVGQTETWNQYVQAHLNYLQSSYSTDIVPMVSTPGFDFVLEDANNDLGVAIYKGLSVAKADYDTASSFLSISSYFDIDWGKGGFSFKVPDAAIANIGHSEYDAILYQLMASDAVYNGILDTFSMNYYNNLRSMAKSLSDNSIDLAKSISSDGVRLPDGTVTTSVTTAKKALQEAAWTLRTANPDSAEFSRAYRDFESLGNQFLDQNKTKVYLNDLSSVATDTFSFMGSMLDGIGSIGKAYQYACWAESYAQTSTEFKDVLKALREAAYQKAWEHYGRGYGGDYNPFEPYSESSMYRGLYEAVDSFTSTMDSYAEDTHKKYVSQIKDKTGDSCVDLVVDFLTDKVEKKWGGSICPELAAINSVLSSGKLLLDMFTDIDDEYKYALAVQSLGVISNLLIDISKKCGDAVQVEEVLDTSIGGSMRMISVPPETRFGYALKFDQSIRMYKNSMLLACDYGMKYEKSKLNSLTSWQVQQASRSSTAISILALQKSIISDIHCHDDGFKTIHSSETPSAWATSQVNVAIALELVPETLRSKYTQPTTRAELCALATVLYESINGEIKERKTFSDTDNPNVGKMAALGVVNGIGNGMFSPNAKLTREQAATMLSRLAESIGKPIPAQAASFADSSSISSWAKAAVGQMQVSGIMNGTGNNNFTPAGDYTREQSIVTMMRLLEYVKA